MARRSDNTREEIKKMAIVAGINLLENGGISALTARAIAARIGYTVGTLYNVFEDLEDIVMHINAATLQEMHAMLAPLAEAQKSPEMRILEMARGYADYARANPARWNLLHHSPRNPKLPAWFHEAAIRMFTMGESVLLASEGISKKAAHDAARVLWAGLHGICALSINQKLEYVDAEPMHALIENFVRCYLKGMKPDNPS